MAASLLVPVLLCTVQVATVNHFLAALVIMHVRRRSIHNLNFQTALTTPGSHLPLHGVASWRFCPATSAAAMPRATALPSTGGKALVCWNMVSQRLQRFIAGSKFIGIVSTVKFK